MFGLLRLDGLRASGEGREVALAVERVAVDVAADAGKRVRRR